MSDSSRERNETIEAEKWEEYYREAARRDFERAIAIIFWRHRKLWTVVYPDGQRRTKCELAVAKDYKELFGGKVVFRG